jgi:hypothetical protein
MQKEVCMYSVDGHMRSMHEESSNECVDYVHTIFCPSALLATYRFVVCRPEKEKRSGRSVIYDPGTQISSPTPLHFCLLKKGWLQEKKGRK